MASKKLNFIQSLRGLAALMVVFYHGLPLIGLPSDSKFYQLLIPGGSWGVDLFFIISGFIMVITTMKSDGSLAYTREFLIRKNI